jgi:hypothetical protein
MLVSAAMAIRSMFVLAAALAIGACGSKSDDKSKDQTAQPDPRAAAEAKALADLGAVIQQLPPAATQREPMRPTPAAAQDPRASTYYEKAAAQAKQAMTSDTPRDEILSYIDRWPAAPAPIRALAASQGARDAAVSIAVGAGATAGATPGAAGDDPAPYQDAAAAAIAAALESDASGSPEAAGWQLLGVVRLGQDLTRAATFERTDASAAIMRSALAALRQVATNADRKKLTTPQLTELLAGCQRVRATQPAYTDVLAYDLRTRADALRASAGPAGDAGTPTPTSDALKADLDRLGGVTGYANALAAHGRAILELAKPEPVRAAPRQEKMLAERTKAWGDDGHPSLDIDRYGRWLLAGADLDGTCIALALELDRRTRKGGALAPTLGALTPRPLEQPILDPLGVKEWEYVDDGLGGRLLRTMPIVMGDATANVEMRITKRR